jgi:hypothetical protein
VTRFVVDCETLLGIAAGETEVAERHQLVAPTLVRRVRGLTRLQADVFVTSDRELAEVVSGLVETATSDALH